MDDALQYWQEVGQWEQAEEEDIERANEMAAEARDEQFRAELEDLYPILKGWK
jgi:hypothetical protein